MTKNTLLNIVISVSRLLKIILILAAIGLTGLFVYAQINKEAFADQELILSADPSVLGLTTTSSTVWMADTEATVYDLKPYTFGKLSPVSLYINYFKWLIIMALMFLIFRAFEAVMLSVKTLNTFSNGNVKRFRHIGVYIIFVTILTSYTVLRFENGDQSSSYVSFTPVICTLLAFIMAEIFKEGEHLRAENDLTI